MKRVLTLIFLLASMAIFAEQNSIYIREIEGLNVNQKTKPIIAELLKMEFEGYGYTVMESESIPHEYTLKVDIIRFEAERAYFIATLYKGETKEHYIKKIITDSDKLDIFISRTVKAIVNRESIDETKDVANVLAEEETISENEQKMKMKMEGDVGIHFGTVELNADRNYHYLPAYLALGVAFYHPDFFFSIKSFSFVQGLGLRIGMYKIANRNVNSYFFGADIGAGVLWGPYSYYNDYWDELVDVTDPYVAPVAAVSFGGMFFRTMKVSLKPELRLEFNFRKSTTLEVVSALNGFVTIVF